MKRHSWLEGALYDRLVTPMSEWLMGSIIDMVPANSLTLEIGCGPGELACRLSKKCQKVTAIDISERMIEYAKRKKDKLNVQNVEFQCFAAAELKQIKEKYNYAVASFCLHEMDPQERIEAVTNCLDLSEKMIIADYQAPFPKNSNAFGNNLMEIIAGPRHHRNFKSWQAGGGIDGFIKRMSLQRFQEDESKDLCAKSVVVSR